MLSTLDMGVQQALPGVGLPAGRDHFLDDPDTAVVRYLQDLSARAPRPLVVFFDETDCLVGATMVSFLTQLRHGYLGRRKVPFPHSIVLVGQRSTRNFVTDPQERNSVCWLESASPFHLNSEATSIASFAEPDVAELLAQHTTTTGQRFEPQAVAAIYDLSQGQPWLVCALADQIVDRDVPERSLAITAAHVDAAKETIILERRTHIDSLIHKLRDPRVRKILEPMLIGNLTGDDVLEDDLDYVLDLGVVRVIAGRIEIANPIYHEVIPRALTYLRQPWVSRPMAPALQANGSGGSA